MLGFFLRLIPGYSTLVALMWYSLSILYPAFESFKALESAGASDDTQWLSYWVSFSVLSTVEKFAWPVLMWIPLYSLGRVALISWLVLPQFKGATFVYQTIVRPFVLLAIDKAKAIPALEPYLRDFNTSGSYRFANADATSKLAPRREATNADVMLKTHAQ